MNTEVIAIRTSGPYLVNYCYILIDLKTKQAVIIDPAWELELIEGVINKHKLNLTFIALTHSHHDHVNLVEPLVEHFNASVLMSQEEINYYGYRCRNLMGLQDREEFWLGSTRVLAIHTPGHTAGSMCFWAEQHLFTGDTLFIEGCGFCHLKGGSAEEMFYSIQEIKGLISPQTKIYPGHCYGSEPGISMEELSKQNIYIQLEQKEHFISFRMRSV
ncbi:glyoxylase-like metal-dependent hydrolase (beta-lactamase superfamily II) [Paenibacillus shirakamiensis]|uniref:Glyoxylase-like metal-dependent hydrolase (Beta-lactamase superfamily II) n=1 Tax=Paenibacillus shirakamiensis TaxID=1265935 RepID=A0ABS4JEN9_9BACL|nr:MBL fold metallo-hydrolase [Paenibacillus shirakamiensis]MBP2000167.1 glyoxylase-like metal-dependent hydrolase (beta-lactamase superfamily II) [Paenibacillus shirakamiensis]